MTATISLARPEKFERKVKIEMNDGSDFFLILRQPTFEFQLEDMRGAGWGRRFEEIIKGWEGVNVEDKDGNAQPLGFSRENFARICENYPTVFNQSAKAVIEVLNDLSEDDKNAGKSSSKPSGSSSEPESNQETNEPTERSSSTSGGESPS